jgi:hypothetical protein
MTIKKVWCLLVLAAVLLPVKGFPEVTSRIQGVVKDFHTGEPIWSANVILLYCERYDDICDKKYGTFTDIKGFFQFHFLQKGTYRLLVYNEGYADFGPFFKTKIEEILNSKRRSNPSLLGLSVVIEAFEKEKIFLQEGDIKHVTIELKKEAILEIRFNKKTKDGTGPLYYKDFTGINSTFNFGAMVSIQDDDYKKTLLVPSKKDIGIMIFKGLPPGYKVWAWVCTEGYPNKHYYITLEEGKTHIIDHLLDFTTGQVIHGVLTEKNSGKPLPGAMISIYNIEVEKQGCMVYTDVNGEYWLGGFIPGKYMMTITPSGGEDVRIQLDIKENQKLEINREF